MKSSQRHTLSVLVENKPGVLTRVSALFSRRAFNIHSLAVGPTDHPDVSRITVVVKAEDVPFEQITKQLNKLVHVIKIVELEPEASVQRKLTLVKVKADHRVRSAIVDIVNVFRAHVIDLGTHTMVIEAVGSEQKTDALLSALEPYGIEEIVQSGLVGIGRAARSMTDQLKEK